MPMSFEEYAQIANERDPQELHNNIILNQREYIHHLKSKLTEALARGERLRKAFLEVEEDALYWHGYGAHDIEEHEVERARSLLRRSLQPDDLTPTQEPTT